MLKGRFLRLPFILEHPREMRLWQESLIHERIFGSYVFFTLIRLLMTAGPRSPHTLIYAVSLAVISGGVFLSAHTESKWAWRARLLIYPVLMNVLFVNMRYVSPLINDGKMDATLMELDKILLGGSLSEMMTPFMTPAAVEILSFCYMFFMIYLFSSMLYWLFAEQPIAKSFYGGLFSLYGIGYFGYTLVPAIGPYIAYASEFSAPLRGYFMSDFLSYIYPFGTNYTDIFPSLHCAVTLYLIFFDLKRNRAIFYICLIPCVGIIISTVGLRYHYFIDLLAGTAAAFVSALIANSIASKEKSRFQ
jgi:membrane-associated phospholipid phosphatase